MAQSPSSSSLHGINAESHNPVPTLSVFSRLTRIRISELRVGDSRTNRFRCQLPRAISPSLPSSQVLCRQTEEHGQGPAPSPDFSPTIIIIGDRSKGDCFSVRGWARPAIVFDPGPNLHRNNAILFYPVAMHSDGRYRRKQFSSCDACRKSRVACDALGRSARGVATCTRCASRGRHCSFEVSSW
jgi:hypothetical protein